MNNMPAFPVFPETGAAHAAAFQGMTLRDYFAAKAMQGIIEKGRLDRHSDLDIAKSSYAMADAMMKVREA